MLRLLIEAPASMQSALRDRARSAAAQCILCSERSAPWLEVALSRGASPLPVFICARSFGLNFAFTRAPHAGTDLGVEKKLTRTDIWKAYGPLSGGAICLRRSSAFSCVNGCPGRFRRLCAGLGVVGRPQRNLGNPKRLEKVQILGTDPNGAYLRSFEEGNRGSRRCTQIKTSVIRAHPSNLRLKNSLSRACPRIGKEVIERVGGRKRSGKDSEKRCPARNRSVMSLV
jgi:hypothetical protein